MASAVAQGTSQERPVMVLVGGSVSWDSNVFLLADTDPAPLTASGDTAKSDRIVSAYAGLRVDKAHRQQRFVAALTKTAYRYDNFPHLDFEPLDYAAAWLWTLSPRVRGRLSADRSETLASYADFTDISQRNVITTENRRASIEGALGDGWHLLAGARQEKRDNSAPFVEQGDYRAAGGEAGVLYVSAAGNSLTVQLRSLDGDYVEQVLDPLAFVDTGFRQTEAELLAAWKLVAKSALDLRVAAVDYRSSNFSERDFSGTSARAALLWSPTGKLTLAVGASRDLAPWTADYASYRVDDTLSFVPAWQVAPRTVVRLRLERIASDYRNPIPTFTGELRSDTLRRMVLAADWKPWRNLSINAGWQQQRRTSTDPAAHFVGRIATLSASLAF